MRRLSPAAIALIALAAVVLLGLLYVYATRNGGNPDALGDEMVRTEQSAADVAAHRRCSSTGTIELIKREVLRRAALRRPAEMEPFEELAASASVRVDNPVLESDGEQAGLVLCSGTLSIDLPPGIEAPGGRRTLSGSVDYQLRTGPEGDDIVSVGNVDALVSPLAVIARVRSPVPGPAPNAGGALPTDPLAPIEPPAATQPPQPSARPSFDCSMARTRGEQVVCSDSGLAELDRAMADQYRRAVASASPQQRALLASTRDRFLGYRDRCQTRACIADAYSGRMREIRDIVKGRWQPPR